MILVDFDMLVHRCFQAMDHLLSSDKQPTGMEYGVCRILKSLSNRIAKKEVPLVLCLESRGQQRPEWYKANRKKMEDSFYKRKDLLMMHLQQVYQWARSEGHEADQVMYTLSSEKQLSYIYTNDSDLFQAISDNAIVVRSFESQLYYWNKDSLFEKHKVWPWQYAFFKTLRGDRTDTIPGIHRMPSGFIAEIARYAWNTYAKEGIDKKESLRRALADYRDKFSEKLKEQVDFFNENLLSMSYDLINLDKDITITIQEPGGASIQKYLDFLEIKSLSFEEETEF